MEPLIITSPRSIPYSSNKAIPWNYGVEVYYHGVNQEPLTIEDIAAEATTAMPIRIPTIEPVPKARGKEPVTHPAQTEVPKEVAEDTSKRDRKSTRLNSSHRT